jgi:hypothetical protein
MDTAVVVAIVTLVQAISVAVINGAMKRREESNAVYREKRETKEREREKEEREREALRNERDDRMAELVFAALDGNEVLLRIAQGEGSDSNVDRAVEKIGEAREGYNDFVNKMANRI